MAYVQNKIIDRKDFYIGKKFGVVLEDLNISIKSFLYSADANNIATVSSSAFLIYDSYLQVKNKLNKGEIPVVFVVRWSPSLKSEDLDKLNSKKRKTWRMES